MAGPSYRFGPFFADRTRYRVVRDDAVVELTPKLLDLLLHLLDNSGTLVTKEQLLDALWPRLIAQADANYGLRYKDTSFVPRRDGLLLQVTGENDYYGYDNESATPDRAEAEHAVTTIGSLFAAPSVERKPA